jgi:L-seryl-tRNA(Ser) seleniumtransferase
MTVDNDVLRSIPKIDELLKDARLQQAAAGYGQAVVVDCARTVVGQIRQQLLAGERSTPVEPEQLRQEIVAQIGSATRRHLRPVINGTGILLHTNLGRAVLSEAAAQAAYEVARNYSTLEYDVETGGRGSRYSHVDFLLEKICGCESALVVNNNAAAVLLMLSTLARGKEVIVSRGELVEIGGSFRVPEVMAQSGATLVEVGSTNKTRPSDYEAAIDPDNIAALLKVHTSNFAIMGFTQAVSLTELVAIGHQHDVPVLYDMGSGGFFMSEDYQLEDEPNVMECVKSGVDIICFSGDKLLGGPQAGIILGKKKYLDLMKKNPLTRALRVDKMTLAALEATLRLYLDRELAEREIPLLAKLGLSQAALHEQAREFTGRLSSITTVTTEIIEDFGQVGGGSLPNQMIPSVCVAVAVAGLSAQALDRKLNAAETPIIGRIHKNRYLLDMRTIESRDVETIAMTLKKLTE